MLKHIVTFTLTVCVFFAQSKVPNRGNTKSQTSVQTKKQDPKTQINQNNQKKNTEITLPPFETDPLLEKPLLYREDIYPREYIGEHQAWVEENKRPLEFTWKFYGKLGYPVFPGLFPDNGKGVMEQAGMDLFSGDIFLALGAQTKAGKSSVWQAEAFYVSFTSGEGSGLAKISDGNLAGTTSLSGFGGSISFLYYIMDYLYVGVGSGAWQQKYTVEYLKKDVFIDLSSKTLQDTDINSVAPLAILSLGADIPLYHELRALWGLDYYVAFYKQGVADFLSFSLSVAYLMGK